ncbi:hypothetical protein FH972_023874 [Carpinus fangiana]|uniref:Uncharacterized protein n=1 Tax=Carpinus fangiana TaxID=176857 RepID=A0A5N6KWG5_9ROSI|nr:hypothetical protein FH972_023874 [Carpinus fangiana]
MVRGAAHGSADPSIGEYLHQRHGGAPFSSSRTRLGVNMSPRLGMTRLGGDDAVIWKFHHQATRSTSRSPCSLFVDPRALTTTRRQRQRDKGRPNVKVVASLSLCISSSQTLFTPSRRHAHPALALRLGAAALLLSLSPNSSWLCAFDPSLPHTQSTLIVCLAPSAKRQPSSLFAPTTPAVCRSRAALTRAFAPSRPPYPPPAPTKTCSCPAHSLSRHSATHCDPARRRVPFSSTRRQHEKGGPASLCARPRLTLFPRTVPQVHKEQRQDRLCRQRQSSVIKALYDYQAPHDQRHDYLSFSTGDFLHVVARENDPDWYEACNPLHNTRGLVPANHFEEVGKQHTRASTNSFAAQPQQAFVTPHDSGFSEKESGGFGSTGGLRMSKLGRGNGAMVYGIVQYDFKAERPDELDAKAGEAIIVIAQSNAEWFVAKPIQRLGGPGLIPVSFIEIRDMTTGVPKVEEWKRMAAEYKDSSIPLGTLGQMGGQQALAQDMQRMSINSARQSQATQNGVYAPSTTQTVGQRWSQAPAPIHARVPRYCHHDDEFWFIVEAQLEDGRHWDLSRNYKDFYGLQLQLKDNFPAAAGVVPGVKRTLPLMPGPVPWVSEHITQERRSHLDRYLVDLIRCKPEITTSWPVKQFFAPRQEDVSVQDRPQSSDTNPRNSGNSSQHSANHDSHSTSTTSTYNTSPSRNPQPQPLNSANNYQQQQQQPGNHYRQPSDLRHPNGASSTLNAPPILRNNSAMTSTSALSSQSSSVPVKVKVWFGHVSCIIIRIPPTFTHHDLMQKLHERWEQNEASNNGVSASLAEGGGAGAVVGGGQRGEVRGDVDEGVGAQAAGGGGVCEDGVVVGGCDEGGVRWEGDGVHAVGDG